VSGDFVCWSVALEMEPSVATILTSFENSFDLYGALSTPLYQTATFKQVNAV
jgi:cysteine-S-conjugate beta-lyase